MNNDNNMNSNSNNTNGAEQDGRLQSLLGTPCSVRGADASVKRGQLLEVRYLWTPALLGTDVHALLPPPLYGFVRVKDVDHRLSGWFPLEDIELKESRGNGNNTSSNTNNNTTAITSSCGNTVPDCGSPQPSITSRINRPVLSSVYCEVTPGMVRTRREEKQLDFFEERLLRDCRTPTTVRNFVYLCNFVFAPWYYAPYGIFHGEYDPMAPSSSGSSELQQQLGLVVTSRNPFIRDAYLCPFSLRIYSTFEQMRYETLQYRSGRLRPPGQEIYRDEARGFSMFEVNGGRQVTYCRHLFLLGKSFLENKLAGHDVHNYYFYIVCLHQRHFPQYVDDPTAMYFAGYFTWEKQVADNNLACIVTLPCFAGGAAQQHDAQKPRLGHFGQFMIAASYELAYRRKHVGSPEKPLSDLGASAYDRYWRRVLITWMHKLLTDTAAAATVIEDNTSDEEAVSVVATQLGRRTKRPRAGSSSSSSGGNNAAEDDADTVAVMSVCEIAHQAQLEKADVLRTLLHMGLLHLNAEDRSLRLVIPVAFVRREYAKAKQQAKDLSRAEFNAALLTSRGGVAWATSSTSLRQQQHQQKGQR
ncbi:histone acetyltransferase [Trypanosoma grayi]|uniref:histone acetyltransferase n=1 Tax=Trypanosoma grayi TaxID=71804 RepID=UPI0004F47220|nr:histone acetyltransferase [Trypanosoma grayi]KEG07989.1 histone acetyltransferase [Trypanosoma grayi]